MRHIGTLVVRYRYAVMTVWLVLAVAGLAVLSALPRMLQPPDITVDRSASATASELIAERFPDIGGRQVMLAFTSRTLPADDPAYRRATRAVTSAMAEHPGVGAALPVPRTGDQHARHAYVMLGVRGDPDTARRVLPELDERARNVARDRSDGAVSVALVGLDPVLAQLARTTTEDVRSAEVYAVPVAALLLALGLGSLGAAALVLLLAGTAIVLGLGILTLTGLSHGVDTTAVTVVATVGLGVGLDYALLLTLRHRDRRAAGLPPDRAAEQATVTAGATVVLAGTAVVATALGLLLTDITYMRTLALAAVLAASTATLAALTLMPALLTSCDRVLGWGPMPWTRPGRRRPKTGPTAWELWTGHLLRHPGRYATAAVLLLLLAAAPVLGLRTALHFDRSVLAGTSLGDGLTRMEDDRIASLTLVALPHPVDAGPVDTEPLSAALDGDPRVSVSAALDNGHDLTLLLIGESQAPDTAAAAALQRHLREDLVPRLLPAGQPVRIAGPAATVHDLSTEVGDQVWLVLTVICCGTFVLTFLVFRSVVVPLKAIAMNLLCVGAAFGVLALVTPALGYPAVNPLLPLIALTLVFGLSMDYEVFLVHRIAEHYRAHGDNAAAVLHGLRRTALPISLAAGVLVVSLTGLLGAHRQDLRQIGFVVMTAVVLDATVVRMVLAPALMRLMGRANWWLPAWCGRLLPSRTGDARVPAQSGAADTAPSADRPRV
ncbi:MMPL family transporter [Streptomyces sp. TRM S81-3]|uniref:MMPL family transporter n=1 Tax=Streptomyces griseicoloratus TaxID=2752516 RepID=A0A926L501_9ACTN|nr:MMPL family transporter [Streptomyces griseicoloratus]MBD0422638.1 MMPL family transporter [Streptomyces griseicoloratus]